MNKKQLLDNLTYYIESFESERNLGGGLLKSRSGNLWNACLQFVNAEYITPNKIDLLMKADKPNEYSLFKVSAFFDVYESLCFNYDFVCRASGFCHLAGINRSTLEKWGRVATTEYKEVTTPIYNINNPISNNSPISSNIPTISSDSSLTSTPSQVGDNLGLQSTNPQHTRDVIQGSSSPSPISNNLPLSLHNNQPLAQRSIVSLLSTEVYKKILYSNLETVTNKMQGGEGNTVGFITEYNAVREDIQERTDTAQEIVADVKAIATRYGIQPQLEDGESLEELEQKNPKALILQGLEAF